MECERVQIATTETKKAKKKKKQIKLKQAKVHNLTHKS